MFIDLLKQELGDSKEASGETRFCCPFCGEVKYKFYVNNDNGLWICFKCSEQGNPLTFTMKYFSVNRTEAVDILVGFDYDVERERDNKYNPSQYGNGLSEEEQLYLFIAREGKPFEEERERKRRYKCPSPPTNCKNLMANFNNPEAYPFFQYLNNRGVTLEQIKKHNISYVTYGEVSLSNGKSLNLVNHLVFYTFDTNRNPVYWNTRSIEPNPFIKSFNAPSVKGEYSKNNTIFNLNNAMNTSCIVVTESVFDAMTIGDSGVGTFGKKVSDEQINLLIQASEKNNLPIYLFLDSDAGKEMIDVAKRIKERKTIPLYYVINDSEQDPNDLGREKSWELINKAVPANSEGDLLLTLTGIG